MKEKRHKYVYETKTYVFNAVKAIKIIVIDSTNDDDALHFTISVFLYVHCILSVLILPIDRYYNRNNVKARSP
jgi:hypothetical protein